MLAGRGGSSHRISGSAGSRRMIDNAREVADEIQATFAPDTDVSFEIGDQEDHSTIVTTILCRALRFVDAGPIEKGAAHRDTRADRLTRRAKTGALTPPREHFFRRSRTLLPSRRWSSSNFELHRRNNGWTGMHPGTRVRTDAPRHNHRMEVDRWHPFRSFSRAVSNGTLGMESLCRPLRSDRFPAGAERYSHDASFHRRATASSRWLDGARVLAGTSR